MGCFNLGVAYRDGLAVEVDKAKAAAYFERGCDRGNTLGCANLANLLRDGDGVPRDEARAYELYRRACEGGDESSCESLPAEKIDE